MENKKYKAFISYSHADRKWAEWLHDALESYRVPRTLIGKQTAQGIVPARLTPVFRDKEDLASSPYLSATISSALQAAENLLVICSPAAARSRWTGQEVLQFKQQGKSDRIFCLIVDGDPTDVGNARDCFPIALRQNYDGKGNLQEGIAEPIAADLRPQADGKALAKIKLIAGLLGVELDDLRQREQQRRQRQLLAITGGSLLATAITVTLAINATLARNESNQRRTQAEDLLGFMVGDLRDNLTTIGRLDLLDAVGKQAMEYFASVNVNTLTDSELLRQAQVMTQIGEIRISQLQYVEAAASFTEAYQRSETLWLNKPDDGERLFNRSQAEYWVGFVHWRSGNLATARDWLSRYRDSALQLSALDPMRADWVQEVAYGHHNLAVLNQEAEEFDAAIAGFESELAILAELQRLSPSLITQRNHADVLSWLGNISLGQGKMTEALDFYLKSSIEMQGLVEQEPANTDWRDDLAFAVQLLAEVYSISGDLELAETKAREATTMFDALVALDEANLNWLRASTKPAITSAYIEAASGRNAEALDLIEPLIPVLENLVATGNGDHNVHDHLANAYTLTAWLQKAAGAHAATVDTATRAIAHLKEIESAGRMNDERTGLMATAYLIRAGSESSLGGQSGAEEAYEQARLLLADRIATSASPYLLDPWVRYLLQTGKREEAINISGALAARRYKPLLQWPD